MALSPAACVQRLKRQDFCERLKAHSRRGCKLEAWDVPLGCR